MNPFLKGALLLVPSTALLLACTSGGAEKKQNSLKSDAPAVEGYVVKPSLLDQSITVSGSLKSYEETVLMTDVSGRIVQINLPEGNFVKKGTLLVKLFDADLQANLRKLQTQLKLAEQTKKRQAELLSVSGISQLEYDQTELQVNSIGNDIDVVKAQISKTEVLAPYDGIIGLRNVSVGAQVTSSTPLATIREERNLKLDFSVPEKYASEIRPGMKVQFSVQGVDSLWPARVIATEGGVETTTRNLKVRAVIERSDPLLQPGAFAKVEIPLSVNPAALMIPTQAVIPQERNKKVIVSRDGAAQSVTIKTGTRKAGEIEVTEGLKAGDTIVVTGVMFIKPKARLKFSKIN